MNEIELGRRLDEALNQASFPAVAVFWLYFPDAEEYRLVVATRLVDKSGPRAVYGRILEILQANGLTDDLPLHRIAVLSPTEPLIQKLRKVMKTGVGIHGVRLTGNVIDNVLIEDAYLYRVL